MSITAPRGTKDILPDDIDAWQFLESKCRFLFSKYNFKEIRTPIFESTDLFDRGIGDSTDIVQKEMYTFQDKGNRSLTLRPEGTASVVRSYLQHKQYVNSFQKYYYMGPMFRYERPQAGRYRQFHQIGLESFGSSDPFTDAELILLTVDLFRDLGLSDITIKINTIGCSVSRQLYSEKIKQLILPHLSQLSEDDQRKFHTNPLRLLDSKNKLTKTFLAGLGDMMDVLSQDSKDHFYQVLNYLDELDVSYEIDSKLVRGLDYYTETVFEVVSDSLGAQNALCGGGRYNHLVESLSGPATPAIGCAFGVERLLSLLNLSELIEASYLDLYFIPLGHNQRQTCFSLINQARHAGMTCEIGLTNSLKSELKHASKMNVKYVAIFGEEEAINNLILVKDMHNRTQDSISISQFIGRIS